MLTDFSTCHSPPPCQRANSIKPATPRANVPGSGTGAGPLPKETMLAPPANAGAAAAGASSSG